MLTTKEAIEKRRSIRKYKTDPIPDEFVTELLHAARLAPSGCNAQPWRFKIVKEPELKAQLAQAAYKQLFITEAPVVMVCCADIQGYIDGSSSGAQDLGEIGAVEEKVVRTIRDKTEILRTLGTNNLGSRIAANVAIAIEHMVLRALDFGLGTCWVRLIDESKIRDIFGWDDNIYVVALLPIGFPAESPQARKRRELEDIMIY
ncbi:MAG: nitroreductase family protein [Deltaproteobacteria bacterium]|nr:nitroreductase family protein [Deltaproteobacteria bacterium]